MPENLQVNSNTKKLTQNNTYRIGNSRVHNKRAFPHATQKLIFITFEFELSHECLNRVRL